MVLVKIKKQSKPVFNINQFMPYLDPLLKKTIKKDKQLLEKARLPIVTVSSTYIEDLKGFHELPEIDTTSDIVFSRAHYSMALAVAVQAWGNTIDPTQAWVVDPTNYVFHSSKFNINFTEAVGKTIARSPFLKKFKDFIDKFARNKLPILDSITPPLLQLTQDITQPILSLHIVSGNILAEQGKQVFQMVTDPHVRADYLNQAERPNITFLVFDQPTQQEFLQLAEKLGKKVDPERVIVTGPPVDPRIIACRQDKKPWRAGKKLKLCLTTGGLGTNKNEMKQVLQQLLPELNKPDARYQVMVYAGTHGDLHNMVKKLARQADVQLNNISGQDPADFIMGGKLTKPSWATEINQQLQTAPLTLIYHPQIVDANELLTHFAFPWADGFISKPSGDMAYDAIASGSFLLTFQEWGEWEHNIREIFEKKNIAKKAETKNILYQLEELATSKADGSTWISNAMTGALQLDSLFLSGTKNIVEAVQKIK